MRRGHTLGYRYPQPTRQRHGSNTGGALASPVFDSGAEVSTDFPGHSVHQGTWCLSPNLKRLQIPCRVSACYGQVPPLPAWGVRGLSAHRPRVYMQSSGKNEKTADRACLSAVVNSGKWWEIPTQKVGNPLDRFSGLCYNRAYSKKQEVTTWQTAPRSVGSPSPPTTTTP